jgi:sodium borate transporter 11
VIYSICEDFQLDFYAMYGCVGLWSSFFLVLYSLFDVSRLMRWSTRSTEEIFALFISIAFCVDAFRDTVKSKSFIYSSLHPPFFGGVGDDNCVVSNLDQAVPSLCMPSRSV